jgi:sRNA-binding carbon storage regulator CsrA
MLVLTREPSLPHPPEPGHDRIVITKGGVTITIILTEIRNSHQARIGIEAPRDWLIVRPELGEFYKRPQ